PLPEISPGIATLPLWAKAALQVKASAAAVVMASLRISIILRKLTLIDEQPLTACVRIVEDHKAPQSNQKLILPFAEAIVISKMPKIRGPRSRPHPHYFVGQALTPSFQEISQAM